MTIDETFDIGSDTRIGVDDSYSLPFRFTGTINKLTVRLGPSQMTAAQQHAAAETIKKATDQPGRQPPPKLFRLPWKPAGRLNTRRPANLPAGWRFF